MEQEACAITVVQYINQCPKFAEPEQFDNARYRTMIAGEKPSLAIVIVIAVSAIIVTIILILVIYTKCCKQEAQIEEVQKPVEEE